jgi:hypothetical protein
MPDEAPVGSTMPAAQEAPAQALASALRGADAVDDHLLDEAVQRLNNLWQAKGLETARAVAECVIDLFFDGRPDQFFDRGKTHLSFTALKQRSDLHVSYLFMWNACAVYDQLRRLPTGIAEALPLSHHKLLLPVKDEDKKRELATQAVATGMSKQEFAAEVSKARKAMGDDSKGGRPPLPAFVKAFGKLKAVVELAESEAIDAGSFEHYDRAEALALAAEVEGLMGRLGVVLERVNGAAGVG